MQEELALGKCKVVFLGFCTMAYLQAIVTAKVLRLLFNGTLRKEWVKAIAWLIVLNMMVLSDVIKKR